MTRHAVAAACGPRGPVAASTTLPRLQSDLQLGNQLTILANLLALRLYSPVCPVVVKQHSTHNWQKSSRRRRRRWRHIGRADGQPRHSSPVSQCEFPGHGRTWRCTASQFTVFHHRRNT
ncbi:hypothetical protein JDV02_000230 [Purpureocillium takamizusanense]|uniref:Uncharacterized protein n=1 Tax=Purpureocillium takamizusanense TaxID=2060973 RepID=A0A9Q8V5B1_9HYPO|nr:uncharacterized protein JDV02_000230 [Purpureocillium takamizusanense]UNI13488.1 hypothetical protein JDV02_000230 [Purpureocillium takamizusanense]